MRRYALHSLSLLIALFIAACGAPDAVVAPTAAPPTVEPPTPSASAPTSDLLMMPSSTVSPAPLAPPAPTASAPTPALPFDQALRQFTSRALLYGRSKGRLMLGDPDSGASLWINEALCPPGKRDNAYGEWSADGRFIAIACQNKSLLVGIYLLDMQTAATRLIRQSVAVGFEWSPKGSRLLVGDGRYAFILDAATGTATTLPSALFWRTETHPPQNVGSPDYLQPSYFYQGSAAMSWSPDGTKIAVVGDDIKVLDAIEAHVGDGMAPILATIQGSMMGRPKWSGDGRFLYGEVPFHQNAPHSPSSEDQTRSIRIEISTGTIEDMGDPQTIESSKGWKVWSPDGTMYVANPSKEGLYGRKSLYQADGTLIRMLTDDAMTDFPVWTPDSRQILMTMDHGLTSQIVTFDLAGHERVIVTTQNTMMRLQWSGSSISQDSKLVAFNDSQSSIVIYDLQGQLIRTFDGDQVMGWRPSQ